MGKPTEVRLMLVRAARTVWDDAGRVCGSADLPCSQPNLDRSASCCTSLAGVDLVLHGDEPASRATARTIVDRLQQRGMTDVRARLVPGMEEFDFGLWEGMREVELEEKFPTVYRQWRDDPTVVVVPQGETVEAAQARLVGAIGPVLIRSKQPTIALVLRPMAMALVRCWLAGKPTSQLWEEHEAERAVPDSTEPPTFTLQRADLRAMIEELRAGLA